MTIECIENIVPVLQIDICKGSKVSTQCVINASAFTLLNLPVNTTLDVILNALVASLNSANIINTQQQAQIDNLLTRVIALGG